MVSSLVGENAEFERQFLTGELEVELTPQVCGLCVCVCLLRSNSSRAVFRCAATIFHTYSFSVFDTWLSGFV